MIYINIRRKKRRKKEVNAQCPIYKYIIKLCIIGMTSRLRSRHQGYQGMEMMETEH
jgi:hypothetical protein